MRRRQCNFPPCAGEEGNFPETSKGHSKNHLHNSEVMLGKKARVIHSNVRMVASHKMVSGCRRIRNVSLDCKLDFILQHFHPWGPASHQGYFASRVLACSFSNIKLMRKKYGKVSSRFDVAKIQILPTQN